MSGRENNNKKNNPAQGSSHPINQDLVLTNPNQITENKPAINLQHRNFKKKTGIVTERLV